MTHLEIYKEFPKLLVFKLILTNTFPVCDWMLSWKRFWTTLGVSGWSRTCPQAWIRQRALGLRFLARLGSTSPKVIPARWELPARCYVMKGVAALNTRNSTKHIKWTSNRGVELTSLWLIYILIYLGTSIKFSIKHRLFTRKVFEWFKYWFRPAIFSSTASNVHGTQI
jgi:hypothetical protein